jgi:hypothetical protein
MIMATAKAGTKTRRVAPTVRILPESQGNVLCFELDGLITGRDHKKNLVEPLRAAVRKYKSYRVVMVYKPTLEGWEPAAADQNLEVVLECMPFCERAAYVNPPKKKIYQMKLSEPLIDFDIRYFADGELDKALKWVKQGGKKRK